MRSTPVDGGTKKGTRMKHWAVVSSLLCVLTAPVLAEDLGKFVDGEVPGLVSTYKGLHAHPELSHHEEMTAALLAAELRKAGFAVTEHVGKYPDGTQAYGVVAILENGPGPRLLIRTDTDALPIVEETGVSYASHVKVKNAAGQEVGVMHVSVEHAQTSWRAYRDAHCDMVAELFMNGSGK